MNNPKALTRKKPAFCTRIVSSAIFIVLSLTAVASGPTTRSFGASLVSGNAIGEQRVLVVMVNFQDKTTQPYTNAQVRSTFESASNLFYENSYQQTWLTGDIYGWLTIPLSSTVCDVNALRQYANTAAVGAGADLSSYSRYVYVFPKNACTFTGYELDGSNIVPSVFINNSLTVRTLAHELGHTFGLFHSQALECGASTIGTSCSSISYGDDFDLMGGTPSTAHLNAYQKERLGWLNSGSSPGITTVQNSGTYFLEPLESLGAGGPKALKILKSVDPVTGDKTWYYVEFRRPLGLDSSLSTNANLMNGVLVHQGVELATFTGYLFLPSHLLDMTPETTSWQDPALTLGRSFQDSNAGVSITPISLGSEGCAVLVSFAGQPEQCVSASPTVTMTPSQPAPTQPGSSVTYSVTVKNNDSASCAGSAFNLQASLPTGWSATFANPSLTLTPGASGSTALVVTSSSTASPGSYNVGATASNSSAPSYSNSAGAIYSVSAPVVSLAVTVSTDKSSYNSNQQVTMRGVVYAGAVPVAGTKVNFSITKPNGALVQITGTTGTDGVATAKYRFNKRDPKGTYQDKAVATVNGVSGSATTSFVLQ